MPRKPPPIALIIRPEDYDTFRALIPNDPEFLPDTYDAWLKRTSDEKAKCLARGDVLDEVIINPEEFAAYCRSAGLKPGRFSLDAFAVVKKASGDK